MKFTIVLAIIFALVATGLLIATCFVDGGALVYASIAGGLALVAFLICLVEYITKSKM